MDLKLGHKVLRKAPEFFFRVLHLANITLCFRNCGGIAGAEYQSIKVGNTIA